MNGEGGNIYTKAKHSLSSISRMINALLSFFLSKVFALRMSDWCFFTKSTKTVLKKKEMFA